MIFVHEHMVNIVVDIVGGLFGATEVANSFMPILPIKVGYDKAHILIAWILWCKYNIANHLYQFHQQIAGIHG